ALLQTTGTGPATLTFWWNNDSGTSSLSFSVNGTTMTSIINAGTLAPWNQQTIYLGAGAQALTWTYSNPTFSPDGRFAYVDDVSFAPGATAPVITTQPRTQSVPRGLNATLSVSASGTPPLYYQWLLNGTPIPGATRLTC